MSRFMAVGVIVTTTLGLIHGFNGNYRAGFLMLCFSAGYALHDAINIAKGSK